MVSPSTGILAGTLPANVVATTALNGGNFMVSPSTGILGGTLPNTVAVSSVAAGSYLFTATTFTVSSLTALFNVNVSSMVQAGGISLNSTTFCGTAVLGGSGTATVNTPAISNNSLVFLTSQNNSGTVGAVSVSARVPGTSFTITSTQVADTSTVGWFIVQPH